MAPMGEHLANLRVVAGLVGVRSPTSGTPAVGNRIKRVWGTAQGRHPLHRTRQLVTAAAHPSPDDGCLCMHVGAACRCRHAARAARATSSPARISLLRSSRMRTRSCGVIPLTSRSMVNRASMRSTASFAMAALLMRARSKNLRLAAPSLRQDKSWKGGNGVGRKPFEAP